jgi:hypothetical protein
MTRNCKWLQDRFEERYETKWFGFNRKNDSESSEKSKTFVGIRTEINHVNKIVTFEQAVRFGWDEYRRRFSPQLHSDPFPKLEAAGATANAKFHKRFRSKTAFGVCGSAGASRCAWSMQ